jgi:hypothetical protein
LQNPKLGDTPVEIIGGGLAVAKVITLAQFLRVLNKSAEHWELELTTKAEQ